MIALRVCLAAVFVLGYVTCVAHAQAVTAVVGSDELREQVGVWAKARSVYYATYYRRSVAIAVASEARDLVVKAYEGRELPVEAMTADRVLLRSVILADLETILNRSLFEAVGGQYQTILRWVATSGKIEIGTKDVRGALKAENCNVIPCDPNECDPKTCSRKSFQRFLPSTAPPKR